jgi:hypothetical protein
LPILVCGVHFDRTPYIRRVVKTLPPRWTGRGAFARETGGQRKYLGPKKRLLTFIYFCGQSAVPKGGQHGDKLKPANLFGRERKLVTM